MNYRDDIFKTLQSEPEEPYRMSQKDFIDKAKAVLNKICNAYSQAWESRILEDGDFPEEDVRDKCAGYGVFVVNGEERECWQDGETGDCFYRFCDYEQVGIDLETHLSDIFDLLSVDEIN